MEWEWEGMFSLDMQASAYCHKWLGAWTDLCIILVLAQLTSINDAPSAFVSCFLD